VTILYVTDQGAQLTRRGNRLVVVKAGRPIHWIHSFKVEQVIIMGNVSLTPSTIAFLLDEGVDTVFLTYHGRFRGRLLSRLGKNIELRRVQFRKMEDLKWTPLSRQNLDLFKVE
jgi:CRISPR-associated protein Cas1